MLNQQTVHVCVFYDVFSFTVFDGFVSYSQKKPSKNDSRSFSKIIQEITFSIFVFDGIQDVHMDSAVFNIWSQVRILICVRLPELKSLKNSPNDQKTFSETFITTSSPCCGSNKHEAGLRHSDGLEHEAGRGSTRINF